MRRAKDYYSFLSPGRERLGEFLGKSPGLHKIGSPNRNPFLLSFLMMWAIAFGDYEFLVDRKTLTYRLIETKTNTSWAAGLSLGWMDVKSRETGQVTRHDFGTMKRFSVTEKAGPQGKRLLLGLECEGIPVDIYLICTQREIQVQLEASRDSKTHTVEAVGLVPGLCSLPEDADGFLVLPCVQGTYRQTDFAGTSRYRVWQDTTMPFVGAVRTLEKQRSSVLCLLTDSAYADAVTRNRTIELEYNRDPERRRLDLRIVLLPDADAITMARTYREKLITDNNHVTLRRKARDFPTLSRLLETDRPLTQSDFDFIPPAPSDDPIPPGESRWEYHEQTLQHIADTHARERLSVMPFASDWAAVAVDAWFAETTDSFTLPPRPLSRLPLLSVVYGDSVLALVLLAENAPEAALLRALLYRSFPMLPSEKPMPEPKQARWVALLIPLFQRTFSAFLIEHRFLTADLSVEEAIYSDKTRIVINHSETEVYETNEFVLPPLGFSVRHTQFEAHNALRSGNTTFPTRAWRIRQANDGKPLELSTEIEEKEFLI